MAAKIFLEEPGLPFNLELFSIVTRERGHRIPKVHPRKPPT